MSMLSLFEVAKDLVPFALVSFLISRSVSTCSIVAVSRSPACFSQLAALSVTFFSRNLESSDFSLKANAMSSTDVGGAGVECADLAYSFLFCVVRASLFSTGLVGDMAEFSGSLYMRFFIGNFTDLVSTVTGDIVEVTLEEID